MGLETRLSPQVQKAKLEYIELRWGVDEQFLQEFFSSPDANAVLAPLGRNARKKFSRYLNSLDQAFACLQPAYHLEDRMEKASDPFFKEYYDAIRQRVGDKQFMRYLSGDWDDEILVAVGYAQKEHMLQRHRTMSEQRPRVHFTPRSSYSRATNR